MTYDCLECELERRRANVPTTKVFTDPDDGSQLLITTYPDGRKTYADRPWSGATWGRPVEAVAR